MEKSKLVFLYLFPSDVGLSLSLTDTIYCRFSSPLKIEIKDTDDIITFNAIVEKKIKNSRINVDDNFFRKFQFYDFFWYGCYENYQNSEKEFFKEIRMI